MYSKRTLCGLVILLDLAEYYGKEGVLLSDIAQRHCIPMKELENVIDVLCGVKLIGKYSDVKTRYMLTESPEKVMMGQVFELLYGCFSGNFIDLQTGLVMRKSNAMRFIHSEQTNLFLRLKGFYSRTSLEVYLQMSKKNYI